MSARERPDRRTVLGGAIGGVAAYALGYLLTYAWKAPAVSDALRGLNVVAEFLGMEAIPTWKAVGWLFYGAHLSATRIGTPGGGASMVNLVERTEGGAVLYLLPPLLLLVAGVAVTRFAGDGEDPAAGALRGATVAIGYFPLAVAGALVTAHRIGAIGASVAPDLVTAAPLAGLAYPLALGALGGALASQL